MKSDQFSALMTTVVLLATGTAFAQNEVEAPSPMGNINATEALKLYEELVSCVQTITINETYCGEPTEWVTCAEAYMDLAHEYNEGPLPEEMCSQLEDDDTSQGDGDASSVSSTDESTTDESTTDVSTTEGPTVEEYDMFSELTKDAGEGVCNENIAAFTQAAVDACGDDEGDDEGDDDDESAGEDLLTNIDDTEGEQLMKNLEECITALNVTAEDCGDALAWGTCASEFVSDVFDYNDSSLSDEECEYLQGVGEMLSEGFAGAGDICNDQVLAFEEGIQTACEEKSDASGLGYGLVSLLVAVISHNFLKV